MPVNKFILKNAKRQAAVKLTGTGQATVSIYDFLAVLGPNAITDTQTITPANVQLHISDIMYDVSGSSNVIRNGNVVWTMNDNGSDFAFSRDLGVVLNEQANANVVVNIGGAVDGTVILQFTKGDGYNDPYDRQKQGPGSL
jgi:hypothetical protein